ncbi:MAG TPA: hypothetical protein VG737_14825, partial [Cyclobacteriaceae bacterium]|nr:hypothetical protein [Cyclobacteriaceae bacterium]
VPYILTARYPKSKQVLFPDSLFSFAPFEMSRKNFFPTVTNGNTSYDSTVYMLTTFEIDSIQQLRLPVFVVQEKDCLTVYAALDHVFLRHQISSMPDSVSVDKLPLKVNTAYQKVQWILNYPLALIAIGSLLVALVVIWLIFGKRIRKHFALKRLNKGYQEFLDRFNGALARLNSQFSQRTAEETLIIWKDYMEGLEKYPYMKLTSREIVRLVGDTKLENALKSVDRTIYGGANLSLEPFQFLQTYSRQRFLKKEEEVRNG